ncbi:MAG: GHKL domain-containing protein [Armatimonadetes bacterium]|nr:GHKL domain-containing protein [Armatimonadota bacterium]
MADMTQKRTDELAGIPFLSSVLDKVERELKCREQVGFLCFDVVEFHWLMENYGPDVARRLLSSLAETLKSQRGKLFRDEDLIAVGGPALDFFVIYLFSPPRRKEAFSSSDLKIISYRVLQKLSNILNETATQLGVEEKIDLRTGYTVIKHDPYIPVERLVYEARKEAAMKSQLEEIMMTFVSNVSHELRTPLTCIKGWAETLLEGALEDQDFSRRCVNVISEEAKRLERLIKDLLDISMLEAHQVQIRFAPVDLEGLVTHAVEVLRPHANDAGVKLLADIPEKIPEWRADEDRLSQVVVNLLDNAIKHSKPGATAFVRLQHRAENETEPETLIIEVEDQGTGIPEEELPRIFERFYRVEKGSSARFGGRGLGLSIARHIIEAHGGELQVESQLGVGSKFRVLLRGDDDLWDDEGMD